VYPGVQSAELVLPTFPEAFWAHVNKSNKMLTTDLT